MNIKKLIPRALLAFFAFIGLSIVNKLYPDYLWFQSFGYEDVWMFQLKYKYLVFLVATLVAWAFFQLNASFATKNSKKISLDQDIVFNTPFPFLNQLLNQLKQNFEKSQTAKTLSDALFVGLTRVIAVVLSVLFGLSAKSWWEDIFLYLNRVEYGLTDPLFGKDISFYFFSLPMIQHIKGWLIAMVFFAMIFIGWIYFSRNILLVIFSKETKYGAIKTHIIVLLSCLLALLSLSSWIDITELVYSSRGVVFGAGYTDYNVILPLKKAMIALFLMGAVSILFLIHKISYRFPYIIFALMLIVQLAGLRLIPWFTQNYIVSPNELVKEKEFISKNITATREAFQLTNVEESEFPANTNLTTDDLQKNTTTIDNIRLWNQEPLKQTFSQLQEIRLYYEFENVDVDRYKVDNKLQQVMLSPRELDVSQLTQQAQTWINQRLVYTHGYGLCMTPVNKITEDGLPHFYIKDIPPSTSNQFNVSRPEIYFGEKSADYVIVNTKQKEFDFPKGDTNVYTTYAGNGGIKLDSIFKKLVFSIKFSDIKIFISELITGESRIIFDREISFIPKKIAPFIIYDRDPYLVLTDEGRMVWVQDGYTVSSKFPYSAPLNSQTNYIRNAVKVTIDAYDGTTNFYVMDESDPIIKSYQKVYPSLFKSYQEIPQFLKDHMKYPKDMFTVQAAMYSTYHMTDPQVFYNREDLWEIPSETYGESEQTMKAYYLVTKLPEDKKESFVLMLPFAPTNKNNMIAWMAAKSDFEDYGKFVVYKLPKEKTIYGPMQIESRIDQDTEISQKLTLWGQVGSRVIRGNLMIIPINQSLLYVEPIYLQATQSKLPELKRVILSYEDKVVMQKNLPLAINQVFDLNYGGYNAMSTGTRQQNKASKINLMDQLFEKFDQLKGNLKQLNWKGFGQDFENLDRIIQNMKQSERKKEKKSNPKTQKI